ncbi:TNT domain-containing protein [Streptococcus equi]|uniref:TNT domain-containing protein n=1 Tax=Streptococcus equi TaxID=1336 RepID=UPI001D17F215|nr:TNT domain-containing protein [Streptococcus equi]
MVRIMDRSLVGEVGDSRALRAMSPNSDFSNYNQYEVLEELPVREGKIAPWFDEPSGGRQYKLDSDFVNQLQSLLQDGTPLIDKLIELGYLRRI